VKTSKFATTLRPELAILALTSAMKVYNKGTQMKINQKQTFLSHGNLHFTGSWRLEKFNETQNIMYSSLMSLSTSHECLQ